ncbi:MAG: hypothetical protein ABIZ82_08990, partial [Candidatus Tumulicola sp.]
MNVSPRPPQSSTYQIDPIERLPNYRTTAANLGMGPSFGNGRIWVNTKNTGDIERVFSIAAGKTMIGSIAVRCSIAGRPLRDAARTPLDKSLKVYTPLSLDLGEVAVEIHPAFQRRRFDVGGSIWITETIFLPFGDEDGNDDPAILYQGIEIENRGEHEQELRMNGFARLRGDTDDDVEARYDASVGGLIARNRSGEGE